MTSEFVVNDWSSIWLVRETLLSIGGYALGAGLIALIAAVAYRYRTTRPLPTGTAILLATAPIAILLLIQWNDTVTALDPPPIIEHAVGTFILSTLGIASLTAVGGHRFGDRIACESFSIPPIDANTDVAMTVRSARRVIDIELPEHIGDIAGQPTVETTVKQEIAGNCLSFPRGLSLDTLESRLITRLQQDWGIEHVDVDIDENGEINRLSIASKRVGLGETLPPGTIAVSIRTKTVPPAGPGDVVEVWETADGNCLVATGMFRASIGDVVTVVVDESARDAFSVETTYRLVAKDATASDAFELIAGLQSEPITITSKQISGDGPLRGEFVGWLPGTVLVIRRCGEILPFPEDRTVIQTGDELWMLGDPGAVDAMERDESVNDGNEFESRVASTCESKEKSTLNVFRRALRRVV